MSEFRFSGSVELTADDKNRFRFPAKYREYLTDYLSNAIDAITLGKVCKRSY